MERVQAYRIRGLSVRVYTRRDVVRQQMERRVGREVGQDLQIDLFPGDVLDARGRSIRLLEEYFIARELNQYGGCHKF